MTGVHVIDLLLLLLTDSLIIQGGKTMQGLVFNLFQSSSAPPF